MLGICSGASLARGTREVLARGPRAQPRCCCWGGCSARLSAQLRSSAAGGLGTGTSSKILRPRHGHADADADAAALGSTPSLAAGGGSCSARERVRTSPEPVNLPRFTAARCSAKFSGASTNFAEQVTAPDGDHDGRPAAGEAPRGGRGGVGPHHRAQTRTAPTAQSVGGAAPGAATRAGGSARHSRTHAQSLPLECGPGRPPAPHCWPAVRRRASRWRTGALTVPAPGTPPAAHQRAGAAAGGRLLRPGGVRVRPPATFLPEAPFP